ncbi:uncharacterized protein LOC128249885 [Octopus bimaculoides]|uniref:uncharacterized protein LOC128249885 n=1 Tax=Octopus bimaculoides TaxID=37653 RepID=UPI0022E28FC3|nr:uncharacterized protein LOC128249885 [Octopus bimaculoides]
MFLTGSIKDKLRTGRPSMRRDTCADVEASVLRSTSKSLRNRSSELRILKAERLTHMTKDLHLKSFRPTFINELSDNDRDKRRVAYRRFLDVFPTIPQRAIYHSGRARNIYFWIKENPHCYEELEHIPPPHLMSKYVLIEQTKDILVVAILTFLQTVHSQTTLFNVFPFLCHWFEGNVAVVSGKTCNCVEALRVKEEIILPEKK